MASDHLPEGVKRKRRPPPVHLKPLKAVSLPQPAVVDCFSLMEEAGCPAPRCQDDPTTSEAMDELLLPGGGGEEARSDPAGRVRAWLRALVGGDFWRNLRGFCRRNGLLTLSVIAVVTGCTLGFMLRGTELSTQVRNLQPGRNQNLSGPSESDCSSAWPKQFWFCCSFTGYYTDQNQKTGTNLSK